MILPFSVVLKKDSRAVFSNFADHCLNPTWLQKNKQGLVQCTLSTLKRAIEVCIRLPFLRRLNETPLISQEKEKHDKGHSGHNCLLQLLLCYAIIQQCTINYKDDVTLSGKALMWNLRPPFLNLSRAQRIYKWKPKEKVGHTSTTWNLYSKWFGIIHWAPKPTPKDICTLPPCWCFREISWRISAAEATVTAGEILKGSPNLSPFHWRW